jgi:hypothetical protein
LSTALSFTLSQNKGFAWLSGILAGFLGFYQPFLTTTDAFALYMVLGALFFLIYMRLERGKYLALGALAGLLHLARADGILWLGIVFSAIVLDQFETERFLVREVVRQTFTIKFASRALVALVGYLAVMLPWYLRNLKIFGNLMPPGSSRTLWVLSYDELFSFPASLLTSTRWWTAGVGEILLARGEALYLNLQTSLVSMGVLIPGTLAVLGLWRYRHRKVIWLGWVAWGVLFAFMTLVFPYSGARGSYFHSGAAFVPLIMALTPVGIDALTEASLRHFTSWQDNKIRPFYIGVTVIFVILFSLVLYFSGVVGFEETEGMIWNVAVDRYSAVDDALADLNVSKDEVIVSANPPGFVVVTGRPSVSVPDGGVETVLALTRHYKVRWVLVEASHPEGLEELYENPQDVSGLTYLLTVFDVHLFMIEDD